MIEIKNLLGLKDSVGGLTVKFYVDEVERGSTQSTSSGQNASFSFSIPVGWAHTTKSWYAKFDGNSSYSPSQSSTRTLTVLNNTPTQPGSLSSTGVTRTTAVVSWGASSDPDGDAITYEVQYGKTDTWGDGWTTAGTTTNTSFTLSGLQADTRYTVRVMARDGYGGESSWRQESALFRTQANSTPTQPGSMSARDVGETAATVSWGASTDQDGDTPHYRVEYGRNDISGDGWTAATSDTTDTYCTISGLVADKPYDVRVRAFDSKGATSDWRDSRDSYPNGLFRTTPPHSVTAPAKSSASPNPAYTGDSVTFSTSGGSCTWGHAVTSYRFSWGDGASSGWGSGSQTHVYGTPRSYEVTARAKCSDGIESPDSEPLSVTVNGRPDLVTTDVWVSATPPLEAGATVDVYAKVKNTGNAKANPPWWDYIWSQLRVNEQVVAHSNGNFLDYVWEIEADEERTYKFSGVVVPATATMTCLAIADSHSDADKNNRVAESSETNNGYSKTFDVSLPGTISVTILPPSAVNSDARWRAQKSGYDTGWQSSGVPASVPVGTYTITFNGPSGWGAPSGARPDDIANVSVASGTNAQRTATYRRIASAAWDRTQAMAGTRATAVAEVEGFSVGDSFAVTIADVLRRDDTYTITGTAQSEGGRLMVRANWDPVWEPDWWGDPEFGFTISRGDISRRSSNQLSVHRPPSSVPGGIGGIHVYKPDGTEVTGRTVPGNTASLTWKVTVKNQSEVARNVRLTFSADRDKSGVADFGPTPQTAEVPANGDTRTFAFGPHNAPEGGAYHGKLLLEAQDNGQWYMVENPGWTATPVVTVANPPKAVITAFSPPTQGALQYKGDTVTTSVTIQNRSGERRSFWVGLSFALPSNTPSWYDVYPVETALLADEASQTVSLSYTLPETMDGDTYYAIASVWDGFDRQKFLMTGPGTPAQAYDSTRDHCVDHPDWCEHPIVGKRTFTFVEPLEYQIGHYVSQIGAWATVLMNDIVRRDDPEVKITSIHDLCKPDSVGVVRKPLLFLTGKATAGFPIPQFPPSKIELDGEVTLLVDVPDLLGVTPEGQDDWVTCWLDAKGSIGLTTKQKPADMDYKMGLVYHEYRYAERAYSDYRFDLAGTWELQAGVFVASGTWPIDCIQNYGNQRDGKKIIKTLGSLPIGAKVGLQGRGLVCVEIDRQFMVGAMTVYTGFLVTDWAQSILDLVVGKAQAESQRGDRDAGIRWGTYDDGSEPMILAFNYQPLDLVKVVPAFTAFSDNRPFAHQFFFDVPTAGGVGTYNLVFDLTGAVSGDYADVFLQKGGRPDVNGQGTRCIAEESVVLPVPGTAPGRYFFAAKSGSGFDNARLAVSFDPETPTYHLTVVDGTGSGDCGAGAKVPVSANEAPPGKHFTGWTSEPSGIVTPTDQPNATVTMPAQDATVTATYDWNTYTVTFDLDGKGTRTGGGELVQSVRHNNSATEPIVQASAGWRHTGWDRSFSNVTQPLPVKATYEVVPPPDPTVTIAATKPNAAEPSDNGEFALSRTGSTDAALTVSLSISGTATPGTDYQTIPTTKTIPAGQSTVKIPVTVINNAPADEPAETVTVAVSSGTGYTVGNPGSATVTIAAEIPTVTLTAPNGGESWQRGTSHSITWTKTGDPGANVKIELYKAGSLSSTIIASTSAASLSYTWPIPQGLIPGTDYRVRITSTSNASYWDGSDQDFTVTSGVVSWSVDLGLGQSGEQLFSTQVFGMVPGATDGWDGKTVDEISTPPNQLGSCYFAVDGVDPTDKLRKDMRGPSAAAVWKLVVQPSAAADWTMSWNPSLLPAGFASIAVQRFASDWQTPRGDVIDMKKGNSVTITKGQTSYFRIQVGNQEQWTVTVKAGGWNAVSIPLQPDNPATEAVLPSSLILAKYEWSVTNGWIEPDTVVPKRGYFVYGDRTQDRQITVPGTRLSAPSVSLTGNRWNLVGTAPRSNGTVLPVPDDPAVLAVYGWGPPPKGYFEPSGMVEGMAYWIYADAESPVVIWPNQTTRSGGPAEVEARTAGSAANGSRQSRDGWSVEMTLAQTGEGQKFCDQELGMREGATDGWDGNTVDRIAVPPNQLGSAYFKIDSPDPTDRLRRDTRGVAGSATWRLFVDASGSAWTATWDPTTLPQGSFSLQQVQNDWKTGIGAPVDMRTSSSRTIAKGQNYFLVLYGPSTGTRIDSITSSTPNGAYKAGTPANGINVTVNFSKPVTLTGGTLDLTLNSGGVVKIAPFANAASASGIYTVLAGHNAADLTVTKIALAAGRAAVTLQDADGNPVDLGTPTGHNLGDNKDIRVDTTAPTLTPVGIASTNPNAACAKAGDKATVTFASQEALKETPSVTIGGPAATVTKTDTEGRIWKAERTLGQSDTEGQVPFRIEFADLAGNAGTPVTSTTDGSKVTFDRTPPTIAIGQPSTALTKSGPVSYTVTYTDANPLTVNLDGAKVTLNKVPPTCTATGTVTVSATRDTATRQVTITSITGTGALGISIAAGTASDAAGNVAPAAGPSATFTVDNTPPTASIDLAPGQADPTATKPVVFLVTFSEDVNGFTKDDISPAGSTAPGAAVSEVTGGPRAYSVKVDGMTGKGTVSVTFPAGAAQDAAGNPSQAPTLIHNAVNYDSDVLTVEINQASGQPPGQPDQDDPASGAADILFTVEFGKPVQDFATGDPKVVGPDGDLPCTVTGSGTTYTVRVPVAGVRNGTITATVPAGVAHDATGKPNSASTSTDNQVTYDRTAPTPQNSAVTVDEDATYGFRTTDFGFADQDAGDALTAVRLAQLPATGTLKVNGVNATAGQEVTTGDLAAGRLTFTPVADGNGEPYTTFAFGVMDGALWSAGTAPMTINVRPVNDPPENTTPPAVTGTYRVGQVLTAVPGVWNDAKDGASAQAPTLGWQWQRANDAVGTGAADIAGATARNYTLSAADAHRFVRVAETATDGGIPMPAKSAMLPTAWVAVANTPPVAVDDTAQTDEDSPLTVPRAQGVLTNDTDADADPLTAVLVDKPQHGNLTLNPDGAFTYAPAKDYSGTDTFTYRANDGASESNLATVRITIGPVNDPPVALPQSLNVQANLPETMPKNTVAITLTATDVDNPQADLSFRVKTLPPAAEGTLVKRDGVTAVVVDQDIVADDMPLVFTPADGFRGVTGFTFTAFDGEAESLHPATIQIAVGTPPWYPYVTWDAAGDGLYNVQVLAATRAQAGAVFEAVVRGRTHLDPGDYLAKGCEGLAPGEYTARVYSYTHAGWDEQPQVVDLPAVTYADAAKPVDLEAIPEMGEVRAGTHFWGEVPTGNWTFWFMAEWAAGYELVIHKPDGSQVEFRQLLRPDANGVVPLNQPVQHAGVCLLTTGDYTWEVCGFNPSGPSDWASGAFTVEPPWQPFEPPRVDANTMQPGAPNPVAPTVLLANPPTAGVAQGETLSVLFTWGAAGGANRYFIHLVTYGQDVILNTVRVPANALQYGPVDLEPGKYAWYVIAQNDVGGREWSDAVCFRVEADPSVPGAVPLLEDLTAAVTAAKVTFTPVWDPLMAPAEAFEVWVYNSETAAAFTGRGTGNTPFELADAAWNTANVKYWFQGRAVQGTRQGSWTKLGSYIGNPPVPGAVAPTLAVNAGRDLVITGATGPVDFEATVFDPRTLAMTPVAVPTFAAGNGTYLRANLPAGIKAAGTTAYLRARCGANGPWSEWVAYANP